VSFDLTQDEINSYSMDLAKRLDTIVFNKIFNYIKDNPNERKYLNPAFPFPNKIRIGLLKDFLVIEYIGPEDDDKDTFDIEIVYKPLYEINDFLGIDISHLNTPNLPITDSLHDMNFLLGNSIEYLTDYFYDFLQKREDFMLNGYFDLNTVTKPIVLNNCTYFFTDKSESLKIKHIDLIEIFPYLEDGIGYHDDDSLTRFGDYIIGRKMPQFDVELHNILNQFIELINLDTTIEPDITKFIENNPELLQLAFGFHKLHPQKDLIWQDRTNVNNLKPDFMPVDMSGYSNIMDFKLPYLKSKPIVGRTNRNHPSYEIDECIAQLDTYEEFCTQKIHQDWLNDKYNIKIDSPIRYIVMGHSKDFSPEDRQRIRKSRNTVFFTYDEFIEMTRFQLYRVK